MTNPDPKRVEAVARALASSVSSCIENQWPRFKGHAIAAIRALDAHDAASDITRVQSLRDDLRNKTNAFGRGYAPTEDAIYDDIARRIDALLARAGGEG